MPLPLTKRFTKNFTDAAKKRGLTQRQIADKAGISLSYVSMLIRGQRTPPLDTLEALAKAVGSTPSALLT